jgi:hypothetical protein
VPRRSGAAHLLRIPAAREHPVRHHHQPTSCRHATHRTGQLIFSREVTVPGRASARSDGFEVDNQRAAAGHFQSLKP